MTTPTDAATLTADLWIGVRSIDLSINERSRGVWRICQRVFRPSQSSNCGAVTRAATYVVAVTGHHRINGRHSR